MSNFILWRLLLSNQLHLLGPLPVVLTLKMKVLKSGEKGNHFPDS
jgi:hypothetical protein